MNSSPTDVVALGSQVTPGKTHTVAAKISTAAWGDVPVYVGMGLTEASRGLCSDKLVSLVTGPRVCVLFHSSLGGWTVLPGEALAAQS